MLSTFVFILNGYKRESNTIILFYLVIPIKNVSFKLHFKSVKESPSLSNLAIGFNGFTSSSTSGYYYLAMINYCCIRIFPGFDSCLRVDMGKVDLLSSTPGLAL